MNDLGPLHAMIRDALPDWVDARGSLRIPELAQYMGISYQALYKIFAKNKIAQKRIKALIVLSNNRLRFEDFLDYL